MALSRYTVLGDGVKTQFAVTFPSGYLNESDVKVQVNNEVDGNQDPIFRTLTFVSEFLVDVGAVPGLNEIVVFTRNVNRIAPENDFINRDQLTETALDENQLQAIMLVQEVLDGRFDSPFEIDVDLGSNRITNLGDPVDGQDATTRAWVEANVGSNSLANALAAAASAVEALASEVAAANSAAAALVSENNAAASAATIPAPADPGDDNKLLQANGGVLAWVSFVVDRITDTTATMKTFLKSADFAEMRTNMGLQNGATGIIGSTLQSFDVDTAKTDLEQTFTKAQRGSVFSLTDGSSITPDLSQANNFIVTLGGNRTFQNPLNQNGGQSGFMTIVQDATGGRTLSFGTAWKFAGGEVPALSLDANAVDVLVYAVRSNGFIHTELKVGVA